MLSPIRFESKIKIENIPIQWIPKLELFYSDLPQFPIVYVHTVKNGVRIYGFPAYISFEMKEEENCDIEINFLSNIDLDSRLNLKAAVTEELEERFGSSNKVGIDEIMECCNGIKEYEDFFKELWKFVSDLYGEYIPYGRYFEEMYSIVRFVSAWQPKTGRQSEMRMLYNFLSIFGEPVEVQGKWDHMTFFLIPTYDDLKNKDFSEFPNFKDLFIAMCKIWDLYFTEKTSITGTTIRSMRKSWPQAKEEFIEEVTYPLYVAGKLSVGERNDLERLVDAFNRHSWRAAFFIWCSMSTFEKDYRGWNKDFFAKFYIPKQGVGVSEKVVACFLQQGFGNAEVLPVDTWVQAFYQYVLGIDRQEDFFSKFTELGKLERVIWLSSQANKTNIQAFFDLMWCTRYGDTGNNELRGPNPISCYECKLRPKCVGYNKIRNRKVLVRDKRQIDFANKSIKSSAVLKEVIKNSCLYVCLTEEKVPKKVFKLIRSKLILVDEFSGYLLTTQKVKNDDIIITVGELIDSLPPFFN